MSLVALRIDASDLFAKATRLKAMAHGVPRAIREGLNEGGDKVRTDVRKALQVQMGTKTYRAITSRTRSVRATEGTLAYTIIGSGKGLPIKEFKTALRKGAGGGIIGAPWATPRMFARSFSLKGSNPDQFRARTTSKRFPVRKLYGPSVPKEMLQGKVPGVFLLSVQAQVPPVILKRLARALGTP